MEDWAREEMGLLRIKKLLDHQLNKLKIEEIAIRQKITLEENKESEARESSAEMIKEELLQINLDPTAMFKG